jgi:heterodisulfide reductase subunit A
LLDHGSVDLEPFTAFVSAEKCGACHTCEGLCPYSAVAMVEWNGKKVAQVNEVLCKGCGVCAAACPAGAVTQYGFSNDQVLAEIEGMLTKIGVINTMPIQEIQ